MMSVSVKPTGGAPITSPPHNQAIEYLSRLLRLKTGLVFLLLLTMMLTVGIPRVFALSFPNPERLTYPSLNFSPPAPQRFTLPNGMQVYFLEDHELPVVRANLLVAAGSMYDPPGKEGCGELTAALMRSGGTDTMPPEVLDETLASLAATIEPSTGSDRVGWSLFVQTRDFDRVFKIFSRIVRAPRFDPGRLKLLKDLKSEEIRRLSDDPQRWAFREFNRLMYSGNPRGRLPTLAGIAGIAAEDLRLYHRIHYAPDNMILAVSGDIGAADLKRTINEAFGDWQAKSGFRAPPPPFTPFSGGRFYLIKETPQSVVIIGRPAPAKGRDDYFAFEVIDHALGSGGFRSRIFQQVRTDRGLAYATGSFYRNHKDHGLFGAYALTGTETSLAALEVIQDIIRAAGRGGLTAQETAQTKKSLLNNFIFAFSTPHHLVRQQAALAFDSLPENFLWQYRDRLATLSEGEVKQAAANWLSDDRFLIFIMGSRAAYDLFKKKYPDFKEVKVNYD